MVVTLGTWLHEFTRASRLNRTLIFGADLNRCESSGALPTPPVLPPTIAHTSLLHCGISILPLSALGHKRQTETLHALRHVRFAPESGQTAGVSVCPLCAKSGLMQCSKRRAQDA